MLNNCKNKSKRHICSVCEIILLFLDMICFDRFSCWKIFVGFKILLVSVLLIICIKCCRKLFFECKSKFVLKMLFFYTRSKLTSEMVMCNNIYYHKELIIVLLAFRMFSTVYGLQLKYLMLTVIIVVGKMLNNHYYNNNN